MDKIRFLMVWLLPMAALTAIFVGDLGFGWLNRKYGNISPLNRTMNESERRLFYIMGGVWMLGWANIAFSAAVFLVYTHRPLWPFLVVGVLVFLYARRGFGDRMTTTRIHEAFADDRFPCSPYYLLFALTMFKPTGDVTLTATPFQGSEKLIVQMGSDTWTLRLPSEQGPRKGQWHVMDAGTFLTLAMQAVPPRIDSMEVAWTGSERNTRLRLPPTAILD